MKSSKKENLLSLEKKTVRRLTKDDQTKLNGGKDPGQTWPLSGWPFLVPS